VSRTKLSAIEAASLPVKKRLVIFDVPHGGEQLRVRIGFQNVAARAAAQHLPRHFFGKMHGQDEHFAGRRLFANQARHFQPIFFRHGQIEHHEVRPLLDHLLHGGRTVGCFRAYLHVRLRLQQRTDAAPHDCVVIHYENFVRFRSCRRRRRCSNYRFFRHVLYLDR